MNRPVWSVVEDDTRGRIREVAPIVAGGYLLCAIVAWWGWRALQWPQPFDAGLFYHAGQVGWATGHPETLRSWDGMPFLAAVMALTSRITDVGSVTNVLSVLNTAIASAAIGIVLYRLGYVLSRRWWWVTAFALVLFSPLMASIWVEQVEVISLVLALLGFEEIRRGREHRGGALVGLSVAIKPLVVLLPFVLIARRRTRRAGAEALAWAAGLNIAAQALFALRAHDLGTLNPYPALANFVHKSRPANVWACEPQNFAPSSLLCRLEGSHNWTLQHVVVAVGVGLLGAWVIDALRGRQATSWEPFAFACALSPMVSTIAWSHYQVLLAPLFVLLIVRFSQEGATFGLWTGLAGAFALASLNLQPYGTTVGAARDLFMDKPQTVHVLIAVDSVAEFAQYVLVITAVMWYVAKRPAAPQPAAPRA